MALMQMKANISKTEAEAKYTDTQAKVAESTLPGNLKSIDLNNLATNLQNEVFKKYGMSMEESRQTALKLANKMQELKNKQYPLNMEIWKEWGLAEGMQMENWGKLYETIKKIFTEISGGKGTIINNYNNMTDKQILDTMKGTDDQNRS